MNFQFYGYTLRETTEADAVRAYVWASSMNFPNYRFWLKREKGIENFLVIQGKEPLAFVQVERIERDQVRLHWQPSPVASPKKLLRGITRLVPLMEKALALRGVRAIFLTSHSLSMVGFMEKLGYRLQPNIDGGKDGVVMAKEIGPQPSALSPQPSEAAGGESPRSEVRGPRSGGSNVGA